MSLFGALFSGVSGLEAQSSAMGAVSDNITNVSTIGYKDTDVNFQTLVTKQVSATYYSAGGVQSKPRQETNVQGLLQASTSQTDVAISGQGFFVVNEAAQPTNSDQYLYTRAGSFIMDDQGYLKNTAGFYLQGWPTDPSGNVQASDPTANPIPNQNIVSPDYLQSINLSRVGGTASATTKISIGANLPANADTYDPVDGTNQDGYQKTDVQFFDTLGNANTISVQYLKSPRANDWDVQVQPPSGTSVLTLYDNTPLNPKVYDSEGLLEFTARPADGSTVTIDGTTYEFDNDGSITAGNTAVDVSANTSLAQDVSSLLSTIKATDSNYTDTNNRVTLSPDSTSALLFHEDGTNNIVVNPVGLLDTDGNPVTKQTSQFTVQKQDEAYSDYKQFTFSALPAAGSSMTINGITYNFVNGAPVNPTDIQVDGGATVADVVNNLATAVATNDPQFTSGSAYARDNSVTGVGTAGTTNDTLVLASLPSGSYNVSFSAGFANLPTEPDGTATYAAGPTNATAIDTAYGINFDVNGLPASFNVGSIEIQGFSDGAADMDGASTNTPRMTLDFGSVGEANGMTQYGDSFTPVFIQQNGAQFGTYAGVTIGTDGLVTALFDNGETRTIYKIPIATFTNPNGLEGQTGNVWNATQNSGDYTLRVAGTGSAGQVIQSSLEASTVDIGEEFTKMIVVQRAYSASTKIITTTDQMLSELTQIK